MAHELSTGGPTWMRPPGEMHTSLAACELLFAGDGATEKLTESPPAITPQRSTAIVAAAVERVTVRFCAGA
ncbi:hypothetical protein D3C72_2333490 [compost metagenome]